MKDIRNYLQFYIGQECEMTLFGTKYKAIFTGFNSDYYFVHVQGDRASITQNDYSKMKLSLRKLSSMTEEHAKLVLSKLLGTDDIIFLTVNGNWAACVRGGDDEYEEWMKDDLDKLNYCEEADYSNVLSIDKSNKSLAYGTDEEMRFFVEMDTYSQYINELRQLGYDCDNLIDSGLAIDKLSTIKEG